MTSTTPATPTRAQRPMPVPAALAGCLLLAPPLMTAAEMTRRGVVGDGGSAAETLTAIGERLAAWHLYGALVLGAVFAYLGAMIALTALLDRARPLAAVAAGFVGIAGAIGFALHTGSYTITLSGLAADPTVRGAAATVLDVLDADTLNGVGLLLFVLGSLAGPLLLVLGLCWARLLPWWSAAAAGGFVVLVLGEVLGGWESLLLLAPFALAARELIRPARASVAAPDRSQQAGSTPVEPQ